MANQSNSFKHINGYTRGMNKDLSPRLYDNQHYFDAEWMTPINNETGTVGPMTNIKGTIEKFQLPSGHTLIGNKELRDKLILISVDTTGYNYIFEALDDGTTDIPTPDISGLGNVTTGNFRLLWTDNPSINPVTDESYKRLGYTTDSKLDIVTRYESSTIQKTYIADGEHPLRYFNIIYNSNTNDYTQFTQKDFNIVPDVTLNKPGFDSYTMGNMNAGVVYYSYQLYKVNGVESAFSETSDPIVLSTTISKSTTTDLKGSDLETNTGIGVILSLSNLDTTYDRIRCVAIEYSEYEAVPTVRIFFEGVLSDSSLEITDIGTTIGTYDLAEFRVLNQYYIIPSHLISKNNMLFAANIQEKYFDLDEYLIETGQDDILTTDVGGTGKKFWDSRSYRYKTGTTTVSSNTYFGKRTLGYGISPSNAYMTEISDTAIDVTVEDFSTLFSMPDGRTIDDVTAISETAIWGDSLVGQYIRTSDHATINFNVTELSYSNISYNSGTDILTFRVTSSTSIFNGDGIDSFENCLLRYIDIAYEYTEEISDGYYALVKSSDGSYITVSGDFSNVPYDHDCLNEYNVTTSNGYYYNNPLASGKYNSEGALGSSGKNINIVFGEPESFILDTQAEYQTFDAPVTEEVLGRKKAWQEDEIYRISVQFRDNKGRESFPKWVIDLRMPDYLDRGNYNVYQSSGETATKNLYPYITMSNVPLNDDGTKMDWRILRVRRDGKDRTVLGEGFISATLNGDPDESGTGDHSTNVYGPGKLTNAAEYFAGAYARYDGAIDYGLNHTYLQLYTPERFFADLNLDGCYLNHQGYLENLIATGKGKYRDHDNETWTNVPVTYICDDDRPPQVLKKYNKFIPASTTTYYDSDESSARLINIKNWKSIKAQPLENYDSGLSYTSIGNIIYRNINFFDDSNGTQGENGSCFVIEVEARNNSYKFEYLTNPADTFRIIQVLIKKDGYPYGGYSFESRFNNTYVPASDYTKDEDSPVYAYYGDVITAYFDFIRTIYDIHGDETEGDETQEILYVPLKSLANLNLRLDGGFNKIANMDRAFNRKLTEEGLADIEAGIEIAALYRYNTVYSVDNTTREYVSIPFDANTNYTYDGRIRRSEVKSNSEYADSWLKFLPNNYIDVDSQYGEITRLDVFKDRLLFWQPKALGTVPVGEKELIPSSNSATLSLGSSGILNRYDYLDDTAGASDKDAILITPTRILFFSIYRNTMFMFSGQTQPLSDVLGMNSWFDQYVNMSTNILSGYNPVLWESWFTFGNYTLVYNEKLNAFTYFVPTIVPTRYITFNNNMYTIGSSSRDIYKHNLGNYGHLHNQYVTSSITLLINPRGTVMSVYDVIEMLTEKYAADTDTELQETFDTIQVYNDYQDTEQITLSPDDNIIRRLRTWRFNTIRDNVVGTNDPKIRSSFIKVRLTFNNSSANEKILMHNLITNYRISKMMG